MRDKVLILLIVILLFIITYNILKKLDIVEGLSGKKEYYNINEQKYKIKTLNDKYKKNNKKFEDYKKMVGEHGKAISKNLGKQHFGINK